MPAELVLPGAKTNSTVSFSSTTVLLTKIHFGSAEVSIIPAMELAELLTLALNIDSVILVLPYLNISIKLLIIIQQLTWAFNFPTEITLPGLSI